MVPSVMLRASLVLLGLIAPAFAAPAAGKVLTPVGEFDAANVHQVPKGGEVRHVGSEIHLLDAKGKVLHVAQHDDTKLNARPETSKRATDPWVTGWTAYADWYNTGSPISTFYTTWTVPPVPAVNSGQTVFLFNSIEPASGTAILQPVLQWGASAAGGGAYWAIATWYVSGSNAYFTGLTSVSVGQSLTGLIYLTSVSGSLYGYIAEFTNPAVGGLQLTNSPQLVWATETLEAYGITQAANYPSGSTLFSGISITTQAGVPSIAWSTTSDAADGVTATVPVGGATNAQVLITY